MTGERAMTAAELERLLPTTVIDAVVKAAGAASVGELDNGLAAVEGTVERRDASWCLQVVSYPGGVLVARSYVRELLARSRREAAATYASRVNWALLVGDVEVDHEDGTARVRTSLVPQGTPVSPGLAEGLVATNVGTAAIVIPALVALASGGDPVAAADETLARIEKSGIEQRL